MDCCYNLKDFRPGGGLCRRPRTVSSLLRPFSLAAVPSLLGRIRPTAFAIWGSAGLLAIPRVEVSPQPRTLWA